MPLIHNSVEAKRAIDLLTSGQITDKNDQEMLLQALKEYDAGMGGLGPKETPFELPALRDATAVESMSRGGQANVPAPYTKEERTLASRGVDILSGLPEGLRQITSLSIDDKQTQAAIEKYYSDKGMKTKVIRDADTGRLLYFNPETKRVTTVNSTRGIHGPTVGTALDVGLQGAGGVAGAAIGSASAWPGPGTYAGTVTGIMAGQAASEAAKKGLGAMVGANPTATGAEQITSAAKGVGEAGLYGLAGEMITGIPKLAWKLGKTGFKPMTYKESTYLFNSLRDSNEIIDQYNELFPDNPVQLNALMSAYINGDDATKEALSPLVQKYVSRIKVDPTYSTKDYIRLNNNLSALESSYKEVADRFRPEVVHPNDPHAGDRMFRDATADAEAGRESIEKEALQSALEKKAAEVASIPNMTDPQIGQQLSQIVNTAYDAAVRNTNKAWNELYTSLGVDPASISMDRLVRAQAEAVDTVRIPLDDQFKSEANKFLGKYRTENRLRGDFDSVSAILPSVLLQRNAGRSIMHPNVASIDSMQAIQYLKELRLGIRRANAAQKGVVFTADQEAQIADITERWMMRQWKAQGREDLMASYEAAKQATREQKQAFEESALRTFIEKKGGTTPLSDYQAVANVFYHNDPAAASDLRKVISGDPESMQKVREMLLAIYRKDYVLPNGKPTRGGLDKFKADYGDAMREFFGDREYAKMTTLGNMDQAILDAQESLKQFKKKWKELPIARFSNPNSQDFSRAVLTNTKLSPTDVLRAVDFMKTQQPELLEAIRYSIARDFAKRTSMDQAGNIVPNVNKMDAILSSRGLHLAAVMGPEWYSQIRAIQRVAAQMSEQSLASIPTNMPPPTLKYLVRALFIRPLSKEGQYQTLFFNNRRKAAARLWYNAVSDPRSLALYIKGLQTDPRSEAGMAILTALNAAAWEEKD